MYNKITIEYIALTTFKLYQFIIKIQTDLFIHLLIT